LNRTILNTDIQYFIDKYINEDPARIVLKGSPSPEIKIQEIVEQIVSKKKCEKKLPTWFHTELIYYPNKINIEQTSSEVTARYKAKLISGNSLIDITGGFGVDSFYFSKKMKNITHCEIDSGLSQIVHYNFKVMKVENIKTISESGIDYLEKIDQKYDWIYVDPSRRNAIKGRVFLLDDCTPNIPKHLNFLFQFSDNILLKTSPLLDISATIKGLPNTKEIHVIAVNNEVKELLFLLKKDHSTKIHLKTINFKKDASEGFESSSKNKVKACYGVPSNFLYEPNAAIMKSGLFNEISSQLNIYKLHANSHLYTSNKLIDFPGRRFKIIQSTVFDKKKLLKAISSGKANITTRNFPQTVAQIRKKTGIKEGGEIYLFFTTEIHNKHIVLICEKV
jgi:hypothetical protein